MTLGKAVQIARKKLALEGSQEAQEAYQVLAEYHPLLDNLGYFVDRVARERNGREKNHTS